MMSNEEYLYNCNGCGKDDKNYPNKEIQDEDTGEYYTPKCNNIEYHEWARNDAYGFFTGLFCHKCYNDSEQYTYRKDRYFDESYAGERLEPEE